MLHSKVKSVWLLPMRPPAGEPALPTTVLTKMDIRRKKKRKQRKRWLAVRQWQWPLHPCEESCWNSSRLDWRMKNVSIKTEESINSVPRWQTFVNYFLFSVQSWSAFLATRSRPRPLPATHWGHDPQRKRHTEKRPPGTSGSRTPARSRPT